MSAAGEVEADATRLEADEEDRYRAFLKLAHRRLAIGGVAGEGDVFDLAGVELGGDQAEHGGELREQQQLAAFLHQLGEHVHQQVGAWRVP